MEHLLQKSKCSIFHNIFKYMLFQRRQKALLWSKGLTYICSCVKKKNSLITLDVPIVWTASISCITFILLNQKPAAMFVDQLTLKQSSVCSTRSIKKRKCQFEVQKRTLSENPQIGIESDNYYTSLVFRRHAISKHANIKA